MVKDSDDDDPLSPKFASMSPSMEPGASMRIQTPSYGNLAATRGNSELMQRNASVDRLSMAAADNPTPQLVPPPTHAVAGTIGEKHVLVMVGLPARGKTHMAKRLERYLAFFHGARTKVFNVGCESSANPPRPKPGPMARGKRPWSMRASHVSRCREYRRKMGASGPSTPAGFFNPLCDQACPAHRCHPFWLSRAPSFVPKHTLLHFLPPEGGC